MIIIKENLSSEVLEILKRQEKRILELEKENSKLEGQLEESRMHERLDYVPYPVYPAYPVYPTYPWWYTGTGTWICDTVTISTSVQDGLTTSDTTVNSNNVPSTWTYTISL